MRARLATSVTARRLLQVLIDSCLIAVAWCARVRAALRRRDAGSATRSCCWQSVAFVIAGKLLFFSASGLYSKLWRFVDARDFEAIVRAVVLSTFALVVVFFLLPPSVAVDPPRGVIAARLPADARPDRRARASSSAPSRSARLRGTLAHRDSREVLIVGAGNGGQLVAAELRRNPELRQAPVGFVDDDPRKQGMRLAGLKVLGTTDELPRVLDDVEPDEVIIAIPSAPGVAAPEGRDRLPHAARSRCARCRRSSSCSRAAATSCARCARCRSRTSSAASPCASRSTASAPTCATRSCWSPAPAARSASELCRQIARVGPKRLVLLDQAENALFEIRRELEHDRHFHRAGRRAGRLQGRRARARGLRRAAPRRSSSTPPPTSTCR